MKVGSPLRFFAQGSSARLAQLSVGRGSCEEAGGLVCAGLSGLSRHKLAAGSLMSVVKSGIVLYESCLRAQI